MRPRPLLPGSGRTGGWRAKRGRGRSGTGKGSVALERQEGQARKQWRARGSVGGPTGGKRHRKRDEGEGASSREHAAGLPATGQHALSHTCTSTARGSSLAPPSHLGAAWSSCVSHLFTVSTDGEAAAGRAQVVIQACVAQLSQPPDCSGRCRWVPGNSLSTQGHGQGGGHAD
jgi:hypothetical protein